MTIKKERVSWLPQLPNTPDLGWLAFPDFSCSCHGVWKITNIHHYADFGATMETFTIEKDGETKEIYSYDEGESFTFDAY